MARTPRAIRRVIAEDETLGAWQERRAREEALTAAVRRHLPRQLGERIRAGANDAGEVEIVTSAGAVATAVRQRAPDVLAGLRGEGWTCAGVRVRVQVSVASPPSPKPTPKPLDRASLAPVATLARNLPAGPLKTALTRFLRRNG